MNHKQKFQKILCVAALSAVSAASMFTPVSSAIDPPTPGKSTIKNLLLAALQPAAPTPNTGTLYSWSGGWDVTDTKAGPGATSITPLPEWKEHWEKNGPEYCYNVEEHSPEYRDFTEAENPGKWASENEQFEKQIRAGLDCSGCVGRAIGMCLPPDRRETGFVFSSRKIASMCAKEGWGTLNEGTINECKAGDIVSMPNKRHCYICIGRCKDGSVLFVHSSPPGVHLCGTMVPGAKSGNSEATVLAAKYTKKYFPAYYERYPLESMGTQTWHGERPLYARSAADYLEDTNRMCWDVSGSKLMSDPDHLTEKTPEEVLQTLLGPC
ncbi:hypothetical protein FACS189481_0280 [Clostridia bacterium]|nr:hypothetical protein FACS189481_0280 [Clostridia bacterium]